MDGDHGALLVLVVLFSVSLMPLTSGSAGAGLEMDQCENVPLNTEEAREVGREMIRPSRDPTVLGLDAVGTNSRMTLPRSTSVPANASPGIAPSDTRASDEEKEQHSGDFPNGSTLTSAVETIQGELSYDPSGTSDIRDWYKFSVNDLLETANSPDGLRNVTISILDVTDGGGTYSGLYEFSVDESGNLQEDYADMIYISTVYTDPYGGIIDSGGFETSFDDQDDTDGWIHDGDHPEYPNNWTFDLVCGRNSMGEEDTNGWEDGLTEVAWYYVGISFNFYSAEGAPEREAYTINYSLEIDTTDRVDTDQGSNTLETALAHLPAEGKWIHSAYQPMDWYKLQGSDPQKLWNISVGINRTGGQAYYNNETGMRWDNWLHVFFVWRDPGKDEEWNTEDDIWRYFHHILSYFISGGAFVSDQTLGYQYPSTVLNAEHREAYVGLIAEPATYLVEEGQVTEIFHPFRTCWSEYTVDLNVKEESPNTAPELSGIEVRSDWPEEQAGGHFGSIFTFNVTYTDEDGHPPGLLEMVIDPDTMEQITVDMLQYEADPDDKDYTDGKDYTMTIRGEDIGEYHDPHVLMFTASDRIPVWSVMTRGWTGPIYVNDTLRVWDDEPISLNPQYEGLPTVREDTTYRMGSNELRDIFIDPENNIGSFRVWDGNEWSGDLFTELLHVNISRDEFGWFAAITPEPNMNGEETVRIRAEDEHSTAVYQGTIVVTPVNDPPIITSVRIGSKEYAVEKRTPSSYILDLAGSRVRAKEDQVTEMYILAEDQDLPEENVPLKYYYMETGSDAWDGVVEIDEDTGKVTLIPTNDDVKNGREDLLFEVHDDDDSNVQELLVSISLENTPDDPTLERAAPIKREWYQGETVEILLKGRDPDPEDELVFDVSIFRELIEGVPPLADQLPYAELVEGTNWGFDEDTGRFWWDISDHRIWQVGDYEILNDLEVVIVFSVTDLTDRTVYEEIALILNGDGPPEVEVEFHYSKYDDHAFTPEVEGLRVHFWAVVLLNPEDIPVTVKWDLGDGSVEEGVDINHTFETYGAKSVKYWYETPFETSQEQTFTFELLEIPEEEGDDDDDETGSYAGLIIAVIVSLVIIILIVAVLLMMMRRKDASTPEPQGPGEHFSPGAAPERAKPAISRCPNCGAVVKEGWYLCPECRETIQ